MKCHKYKWNLYYYMVYYMVKKIIYVTLFVRGWSGYVFVRNEEAPKLKCVKNGYVKEKSCETLLYNHLKFFDFFPNKESAYVMM